MSDTQLDNYFKIDCEPHLIGDMEPINHFPGVKLWWKSIDSIGRPLLFGAPPSVIMKVVQGAEPWELTKNADPESLLRAMDKYGVDIACLLPESMMDTTGFSSRWMSNGDMAKVVETQPDRFMYQPNLSPVKHKGVKNTIWELEYWVKEKGAKIFKFYPPEDTYINDPDIWPFYEKAQELGIVLDIHTGIGWCAPGKFAHGDPLLLEDVARDFPELIINAFHMGYPHSDTLNMVAMAYPNIYICMSLLVPWAITAPRKFARLLGEAMRFVGPDRITWGTDCAGFAAQIKGAVEGLRNFQIPEDMQEGYGYPAITEEDKAKMFGGNLGRLLGIDTTKRRI
ncbi:MAG: amidohydrolase family protein [Bacillota bacterium]